MEWELYRTRFRFNSKIMKRTLSYTATILLLITSSTFQGMQICRLYAEAVCFPSPSDELAYEYPSCCSGCEVQTTPFLDAATSTDKFLAQIPRANSLFTVSLTNHPIQPFCLLDAETVHSTSPPLFILNTSLLI